MAVALSLLIATAAWLEQDPSAGDVRSLISRLGSDSPEERTAAFQKLKALGKGVVGELQSAARESDKEVAARASLLLREIAIEGRLTAALKTAFPGIDHQLATGDDRTWAEFLLKAVKLKTGNVSNSLRIAEEDLDSLLPEAIQGMSSDASKWDLLGEVDRRSLGAAATALRMLLVDENPAISYSAAHTLVKLRTNRPTSEFLTLLRSSDHCKRRIPLWALKGIDTRPLAKELTKLLYSNSYDVRLTAIEAAGELNVASAASRVLELLIDENSGEEMQDQASAALGKLSPSKEIESEVSKWVRSEKAWVRRGAAKALGELSVSQASKILLPLLDDRDESVRASAVIALGKLGAPDAAPGLLRVLDTPDLADTRRLEILRTLVTMREPRAADGLLRLFKSTEDHVRWSAVESLGQLGNRDCAEPIISMLRDKEYNVRAAATLASGKLLARKAVPALFAMMRDEESLGMRECAAAALCRIGERKAAAPLLKLIEDLRTSIQGGPMFDESPKFVSLDVLNVLRREDVWTLLRNKSFRGRLFVDTKAALEEIARQAGLTLEVEAPEYWKEDMWILKSRRIGRQHSLVSALDALEELAPGEPYAFILEPNRIRVLRTHNATDLWNQWADQEKLK